MSASLCKVMLIGNLGRDVELRTLPSGDYVANFSIATSESWKDKQGNKQEETTWHNIVIFGKLAKIAGDYLIKGSNVYLEGKIKIEKYTDNGGIDKQAIKIICHEMKRLGNKQYKNQENQDNDTQEGCNSLPEKPYEDEDIPF